LKQQFKMRSIFLFGSTLAGTSGTLLMAGAVLAKPVLTPLDLAGIAAQATPLAIAESAEQNSSARQLAPVNLYLNEGTQAQAQVTSVTQLSDVQPTDWAYQSLQSLVERYGCIAGYPNGTFQGNRALSRYEFAAGLNACLDRVNELIAQSTAGLVTKEDLAILQRLQEEFAAELATLRGRVDALEARTATLEAQQFSTTTKLSGEAIFGITWNIGSDNTNATSQAVFVNRVRLNLLTSFTGKDVLWTRLQIGNSQGTTSLAGPSTLTGDLQSTQTFDLGSGGTNVILDTLIYTFPVGDRLTLAIEANAGYWPDLIQTFNPYFEDFDGGQGSLSAFAQRSPIYRLVDGTGAGLLFDYRFSDAFSFSGGYMANTNGNRPAENGGLFGGSYGALAQLNFRPSNRFGIALTYHRGYFSDARQPGTGIGATPIFGNVGTAFANGLPSVFGNPGASRVTTDSFGTALTYALSPRFVVNGWFTYTSANGVGGTGASSTVGDMDVISYAIGFAFPDLGKKGSLGGIFLGAQPYATNASGSFAPLPADRATPFHIEAFYRYQVTDNISITPGFIWLTAPNQSGSVNDVIIGTIRTTFIF